jgi:formylglycine-generating enzyme required for sulfatase activity
VDPGGPSKGVARVRRGGAYDSAAANCGSSSRQDTDLNRKQKSIGFRIARTPLP